MKVLVLAESLDNSEYRLRALYGLWFFNTNKGRHRAALVHAERFRALAAARTNANDGLVGARILSTTFHILGDQSSARSHIEHVLNEYVSSNRRADPSRFGFDLIGIASIYLARILWLMGLPEQAMRVAERAIDEARAVNHSNSLSHALAMGACPIARLSGDLDAAEHYAQELLDHTRRHGLTFWHTLGRTNLGLLMILRGDVAKGIKILHASLNDAGDARWQERFMAFLDPRAEAFAYEDKTEAALAAVTETIAELEETEELWLLPEMLRIKGELLLSHGEDGARTAAEDRFRKALGSARRGGALSWELRAAMSLARLLRDQGRSADAIEILRPVYSRFTEGFDTADLKRAKALLDALSQAGKPGRP
jgi:predicted ATPase